MNENPAVKRLSEALKFRTIAIPNTNEADMSEFFELHEFLRQSFPLLHKTLELDVVAQAGLMFCWRGRDQSLEPIGFIAHQDVVPAGEDGWRFPPFSGEIADGYVWGRGALDMKGHMMAIFEAVEDMIAKRFRPMRDLYLFITCNEEIGSSAATPSAKAMADLLSERGVTLSAIIDEGGSIVSGEMFGVDDDIALIGIAEKGSANFRLSAISSGGHSSMPPNHSALGIIAKAIVDLENNQFPASISGVAGKLLDTLAPYMKGPQKLAIENRSLFTPIITKMLLASPTSAALLRSTIAATMSKGSDAPNVLPSLATANINVRIIPGETIESVTQHIENIVGGNAQVTVIRGNDPVAASDTNCTAYRRLTSTLSKFYGGVIPAPYIMLGGTDSRFFVDVTKNIFRVSPFKNKFTADSGIHAANERIETEVYLEGIEFLKSLMAALAYEEV